MPPWMAPPARDLYPRPRTASPSSDSDPPSRPGSVGEAGVLAVWAPYLGNSTLPPMDSEPK